MNPPTKIQQGMEAVADGLRGGRAQLDARFESASWPIAPRVLAYEGDEAIGELYAWTIGARWASDVGFDPSDAVGEPATFTLRSSPSEPAGLEEDGGHAHVVHGIVEEIEEVVADDAAYFRVRLVPRLARLALTEHSRVFTDHSMPEIVDAVLASNGLSGADVRKAFLEVYPKREHVCQFRESDLAFLSRLLEREGAFFHFEHEGDKDVLVLGDSSASLVHGRVEPLRYAARGAGFSHRGTAHVAKRKSLATTSSVRLHDYDPMRPRLAVTGATPVPNGTAGQSVRWGEHVLSPEEATRYAKIRAEATAARKELFEVKTGTVGLRSGFRFGLGDHPHGALNGDFLALRVTHRGVPVDVPKRLLEALGLGHVGALSALHESTVEAMPAATTYRAPARTPWPRVAGVVSGVVDGAASSEYAQIDAEGRYRVSLHFDEGDSADGSRSTWVRMLQPHGGSPEGLHFPLRKQTEVAVIFMDGHPDRPFILGVAPNPTKPSPVQQSNHTKNVIQTGGSNRVELEDAAGGQYITMSTPTAESKLHLGAGAKNFALSTSGRGRVYTGANLDVDVDVDKTEDVDASVTETYLSTHDLTVTGPVTETLKTSLTQTVGGLVKNTWTGPFEESVTGAVAEVFGATLQTHVTGGLTDHAYNAGMVLTVAAAVTEKFTASQDTTVTGTLDVTVGAAVDETFGSATRHIKGTYDLDVSGTFKVTSPNLVLKVPSYDIFTAVANKWAAENLDIHGTKYVQHGTKMTIGGKRTQLDGLHMSAKGFSLLLAGTVLQTKLLFLSQAPLKDETTISRGIEGGLVVVTGGMQVVV